MGVLQRHMDARRAGKQGKRGEEEPAAVQPREGGYHITLVGKYADPNHQKIKACLEYLAETSSYVTAVIEEYFETQYEFRLRQLVVRYGEAFKQAKAMYPLVYAENHHGVVLWFKNPDSFFEWCQKRFRYEDTVNFLFYKRRANKAQIAQMMNSPRQYAAIGLSVAGAPVERVSIELFADAVPATVRSFISLLGYGPFLGSLVHRVVPGGWIQLGDWETGSGGHSTAVDGLALLDEAFTFKHDRPGLLSMANAGPDKAGSQFFITLKDLGCFDGKYTVFGRVVSGMRTIHRIGRVAVQNERPVEDVRVFELQPDLKSSDNPLVAEVAAEEVKAVEEAAQAAIDLGIEDDDSTNAAATRIQAIHRGKADRRMVVQKKELQHAREEERAATQVQSLYRGKAARGRVQAMKHDPSPAAQEKVKQLEEEAAAATKVQSMYRGRESRNKVKAMKEGGAVKKQSVDDLA